MAMECIIELFSHITIYPEIFMLLKFIKENCQRLMAITRNINLMLPLFSICLKTFDYTYLGSGAGRSSLGSETDQCLSKLPYSEKKHT